MGNNFENTTVYVESWEAQPALSPPTPPQATLPCVLLLADHLTHHPWRSQVPSGKWRHGWPQEPSNGAMVGTPISDPTTATLHWLLVIYQATKKNNHNQLVFTTLKAATLKPQM